MKNQIYLLLLLIGGVLLFCCKRDYVSHRTDDTNGLSTKSAKRFLKDNTQKFDGNELLVNLKSQNLTTSFLANGELNWNAKLDYTLEGQQNLEVPFFTKRNTVTLYNFRNLMYDETESDRTLRASYSYTNIVFNRSKLTDSVHAILVTYIPDRGAIEDLKYYKTGKRMTLNNLDTEFSGYIEYRTLRNEVTSVFYIERSVLRKRYSIKSTGVSMRSVASRSQTCRTECTPIYQMVCVSAPERGDGGEVCTQKYVGENCVQVCTEDPIDPENPNPGGQTPNQPGYPITQMKQLISNVFIPCPEMAEGTEARVTLENELMDLLSGNSGESYACFTEKMLQYLSNQASTSGTKLSLCLDAGVPQAGYNPVTKALSFNNNLNIRSTNIFHEIFHAAQDRIYQNGITQYLGNQGKAEIEFETHLFIDIVGRLSSEPPAALNDTNNEYRNFLNGLTTDNNGNRNLYNAKNYFTDVTGQTQSYVNFKNKFKEKYPSYSTPNYNLGPKAIQYFLNNFNCYL